jgi:hypothetical protein
VRDATILFDTAVDPNNGDLYLVWQDARFSGVDEIAFSMSTNHGETWSAPVHINKTPRNDNLLRQQAIIPSIEVGPRGKLVVTYYDYRFDTDDGRESTDYFAIFCAPLASNCRKEGNWDNELRLTQRSFNMLNAPIARGYFLGDYMGLDSALAKVFPAFGMAEGDNLTSIFTRAIRSDGGGAAITAE